MINKEQYNKQEVLDIINELIEDIDFWPFEDSISAKSFKELRNKLKAKWLPDKFDGRLSGMWE